jgi:hypothetical protein
MSTALTPIGTGKPGRLTTRRTRRLTRDRTRRKAANGIERAVAAAERASRLSSAVPVARSKVLASRSLLLELAEVLRSREPVYAQGVAQALDLLSHPDSPLYEAHGDLELAIRNIRAALDGHID